MLWTNLLTNLEEVEFVQELIQNFVLILPLQDSSVN